MCLLQQLPIPEKYLTKKQTFIGWKIVYKESNTKWSGEFYNNEREFSFNRWIASDSYPIYTDRHSSCYLSGFHIFTKQEDAIAWLSNKPCETIEWVRYKVVQVRFRQVTAFGQQMDVKNCLDCVVAQQLLVIKPEVNWIDRPRTVRAHISDDY